MALGRAAALALATAVLAGGCWTSASEGKALRRDIDALSSKVAEKERSLDDQITQLKTVLDDATKLLKRNSANLGADVDKLSADVRTATGLANSLQVEVGELRTQASKVSALEQRIAALEGKVPNPGNPSSPDEMWTLGKTAFEAGRWDEAKELFRRLATGYPSHTRAAEALYFRGEAMMKKGETDAAIGEYQKVFERYAQSAIADDAAFRAGEAAYQLKNCTEARAYFGLLKQKYPKSSLLKQAEAKDKEIRGAVRNKAKCTS